MCCAFCSLILILFSGCESEENTSTQPLSASEGLFPMAIGNMWVHDFKHFIDGEIFYAGDDSMIIDTVFDFYNAQYYVMREQLGDISMLYYYKPDIDGVWELHIDHQDTISGLQFKYPVEAGDKWVLPTGDTMMVASTNEALDTPAGRFKHCIHYRKTTDDTDEGMWFKPGTGWIQSFWREGNSEMSFKLRCYNLE